MDRSGLYQLEEGDLRFESPAVLSLHLESAGHGPEGRRQGATRCVFEALSGLERRLLADHTGAMHFFGMARSIDNRPMSIDQLDGGFALIRDADCVEEEPAAARRVAVLRRKASTDLHADALGFGFGIRFKEIVIRHSEDSSRQSRLGLRLLRDREES